MESFGNIKIGDTFKYGDGILMKIKTVKVEIGRHPEVGIEYDSINAVCIWDTDGQEGSLTYIDDDIFFDVIGRLGDG